jgi:hypothetical protein
MKGRVLSLACLSNLATSPATKAATPAAKTTSTAKTTSAPKAPSTASEATTAPTASATPAAPRKFFAHFRCSNIFLVEDIERPQTDVRDFLLIESDFVTRCCITRMYIYPDSLVLADAPPANAKDTPAAPSNGTDRPLSARFVCDIAEFSNILRREIFNDRTANVSGCKKSSIRLSLCTVLNAL